jgi:hypothetical protein
MANGFFSQSIQLSAVRAMLEDGHLGFSLDQI